MKHRQIHIVKASGVFSSNLCQVFELQLRRTYYQNIFQRKLLLWRNKIMPALISLAYLLTLYIANSSTAVIILKLSWSVIVLH